MKSQTTLNRLLIATERLAKAKKDLIGNWQGLCNCLTPGQKLECLDCPYFKELLENIQRELAPNPEKLFPVLLSPEIELPYSDKVQQKCIEMYVAGYSIEKIKHLTGVSNRKTIGKWLNEAGLLRKTDECSPEEKQRCIELYEQGLAVKDVETKTGIPVNLIKEWVRLADKSRPKKSFSAIQKQQCLELYKQGKRVRDIEQETEVPSEVIKTWVKRAKIHRTRVYQSVGLPIHSPEVREHCRQLFEQGKTPEQIEELVDINADTIREWRKKWQ